MQRRWNLAGHAGDKLQAMVRYICHSDDEHVVNDETAAMDEIVRRVKVDREVSVVYLRAIEREQELKQEGREEGRKEGREEGRKDAERIYEPILKQKDTELAEKDTKLSEKDAEIERLKKELAAAKRL